MLLHDGKVSCALSVAQEDNEDAAVGKAVRFALKNKPGTIADVIAVKSVIPCEFGAAAALMRDLERTPRPGEDTVLVSRSLLKKLDEMLKQRHDKLRHGGDNP